MKLLCYQNGASHRCAGLITDQGDTLEVIDLVEAAAAEGGRVGMTTQADPAETADLRARVAELEQQLAVQRALADERRAMLDQLHATVRALGAGIEGQAGAGEAPRRKWWGGKRN